ncbi:MAG: hypothetical protein AAGJ40_00740 [Planctomycetota bacterium]
MDDHFRSTANPSTTKDLPTKSQPVAAAQPSVVADVWQMYQRGELEKCHQMLRVGNRRVEDIHDHESLELLGLILHDLGNPYEAADAIERASLLAPIRDETRIALASCYAQLRRIDLARELYLQLALQRRLPANLMLQIAAGLEATDAAELAMTVCEWVTEDHPGHAQAFYDMGFYNARSGQPLYVTEAFTREAIRADPGNLHYRIGLISLLIQMQRDDEALEIFSSVSPDQIGEVTCSGCLDRIASMLRRRHEPELADRCERQRDSIRLNHPAESD